MFEDNFDEGISKGWNISGKQYFSSQGEFSSEGWLTAYTGGKEWTDYAVEFDLNDFYWSYLEQGFRVVVRRKDDKNYIAFRFNSVNGCDMDAAIVRNGKEIKVPDSEKGFGGWGGYKECFGHYRIEVKGNEFRLFKGADLVSDFRNDDLVNGGVGLISNGDNTKVTLDNFRVHSIA